MRDYDSRPVLDFICGVLSKNNNTGCYIPEDVYREDCEFVIVITFIYCVYSTTFLCSVYSSWVYYSATLYFFVYSTEGLSNTTLTAC